MSNKETIEEAAERYSQGWDQGFLDSTTSINAFTAGAKWQGKRMYSEEEMQEYAEFCVRCYNKGLPLVVPGDWREQFKKQNNEQ